MKTKINKKRPWTYLEAILKGHEAKSVAQLARYAYKYTDCGAWVGALQVGSIVEVVDEGTEVHEIWEQCPDCDGTGQVI